MLNNLLIPLTIILLALFMSGLCNAIMDVLKHRFDKSIFCDKPFGQQFWNPELSWMNKYKTFINSAGQRKIIYSGDKMVPRFFLSDTMFVFVTDAWHLAKAGMFLFLEVAISIPLVYVLEIQWWWIIIIALVAAIGRSISFNWFYDGIFIKD